MSIYTEFYFESIFWQKLYEVDEEIAKFFHGLPCVFCLDRLNWANYPRKPRGIPPEAVKYFELRFSHCCSRCRKRRTPPSARFMGRRVYVSIFLIIIFCLNSREFYQKIISATTANSFSRRTLNRWLIWWDCTIPISPIWKKISGNLKPNIDNKFLPLFIIEQFFEANGKTDKAILLLLKFLSPMAVPQDYPPSNYTIQWNKYFAQKLQLQNIEVLSYIRPPD